MKPVSWVIRLITASIFAAACESTGTGPGPLLLELSLDTTTVATDDSMKVSLTLINGSTRPVMVLAATSYGYCYRAFEIFDPGGRRVSTDKPCALDVSPARVRLNVGERLAITDWWRPADSRIEGGLLLPGEYTLRGRAWAAEGLVRSEPRVVTLMLW